MTCDRKSFFVLLLEVKYSSGICNKDTSVIKVGVTSLEVWAERFQGIQSWMGKFWCFCRILAIRKMKNVVLSRFRNYIFCSKEERLQRRQFKMKRSDSWFDR